MKNLLTLCKSSFKVQFNFHSFEDKGNFANYDKDCQNFFNSTQAWALLNPAKIAHDYAKVWKNKVPI